MKITGPFYVIALSLVMGAVRPSALQANASPDAASSSKAFAAGVPLTGLTPAQARQRLSRILAPKLSRPLRLTDGVKSISIPRRDLGVKLDLEAIITRWQAGETAVPLHFQVDRAALQRKLRAISPRFSFRGRNARPYEWKGIVRIAPGSHSRRMDVPASTQRIAGVVERSPATLVVPLVVKKTPPNVTETSLHGITGRLSRFTTIYNPGRVKRTKNVRLAVRAIDGTILNPGDVFSMNKAVGPRTQDRGFRTATIFEDGKLSQDIGGGVSQVTGTLFNAALLAGLPIVTYRTHSRPVRYLPLGRDATVSWGNFDMKFRNGTGSPIYIDYRMVGNRIVATLYGKRTPGMKAALAVRYRKLGPRRITAQLYRTIRKKEKIISKELVGRSEYRWKNG